VRLEELKHKPGRRWTGRAHGPRRTAVVKAYASARAPTVAARLRALAAGPAEPLLPEVLLVDAGARLLVLTEVPGEPLETALFRGDAATCERVGAALGGWHLTWRSSRPSGLRPHTVERELEILAERVAGAPAPLRKSVARAAAELGGAWRPETVIHRDLYEAQVMVGKRIGLIDLDDCALGPPEVDVGNLLAHIELLALRTGRDLRPEVKRLSLGYLAGGSPLDRGLLRRCRRLSLLRLACIHRKPALLEHALRAVGAWT
jgi:Ser/Thr protein kinase RdoA (MazF antagonist)